MKNLKVLLIDADSKIPNLALMKLSSHYKSKGHIVTFLKLNIPYYPTKKRKIHTVNTDGYDLAFCSAIFKGTLNYIVEENITTGNIIQYGGTGSNDITITLPEEIEASEPDYSLYPNNNLSYGFISRGCINNCYFCVVPKKEGYIRLANRNFTSMVKHKKINFLDNNFLALPEHKKILKELRDSKINFQFIQGLDIRLLDSENSKLLSECNYHGDFIFAFDNINIKEVIFQKQNLLNFIKPKDRVKFYVYVNPNQPLDDCSKRITILKDLGFSAYLMRDITCFNSIHHDYYTDLAAYCNQAKFIKTMTFYEFLKIRTKNESRIMSSIFAYNGIK